MASILKTPMVEADVAAILKAADSELLFLIDSAQIPRDVQAKVVRGLLGLVLGLAAARVREEEGGS